MKTFMKLALVPLSAALVLAACESATNGPATQDDRFQVRFDHSLPVGHNIGDVIPRPVADDLVEALVICKDGPGATFDVTELAPNPGFLRTVNVPDDSCVLAAKEGLATRTLQVVENVPAGVQQDSVKKTQLTCALGNAQCGGVKVITGPSLVTDPVSGFLGGSAGTQGLSGFLVDYFNTFVAGGEGCTPGYWKNHTGLKSQTNQWPPTGFGQGDSYNATFGVVSSFGGTLLQALNRGGGGENALGRHAVAALLNAAHPGVSYDLSVGQVIAAVQAAYASGDFEGTKNTLAAFNEQGCPIGN